MCYQYDDRPPGPPAARGAARGFDLTLTAADGNRFLAFEARPAEPAAAQVLIYPDVRGLYPFYKELALRFAEIGLRALAIDYFGRTAGTTARDETFQYRPHVEQIQFPSFLADVRAALEYLYEEAPHRPTFTVGFCMGGGLALLTGTEQFELAGIIAFYAGLGRVFPGARGTALEMAKEIHYPVLGLFGGADPGIPVSLVHQLEAQLDQAQAPHDIVIYPDAPHSFFDRKAAEFAEASADAWERMIHFIGAHTPAPA